MPTWPGLVELPALPRASSHCLRPCVSPRPISAIRDHNGKRRPRAAFFSGRVAAISTSSGRRVFVRASFSTSIPRRGARIMELSDVFVHTSGADRSIAARRLPSASAFRAAYLEANYVLSKDMDTDSSERDPFTDRSFDVPLSELDRLYAPSDRDIRHKFNLFSTATSPAAVVGNARSRRVRSRSRRRSGADTPNSIGKTTSSSVSTGGSCGRSDSATATT